MAKSKSASDPIQSEVKRVAGTGAQDIKPGSDFGSREMWGKAANPPSVKAMVGKSGEFAKYKHDVS